MYKATMYRSKRKPEQVYILGFPSYYGEDGDEACAVVSDAEGLIRQVPLQSLKMDLPEKIDELEEQGLSEFEYEHFHHIRDCWFEMKVPGLKTVVSKVAYYNSTEIVFRSGTRMLWQEMEEYVTVSH